MGLEPEEVRFCCAKSTTQQPASTPASRIFCLSIRQPPAEAWFERQPSSLSQRDCLAAVSSAVGSSRLQKWKRDMSKECQKQNWTQSGCNLLLKRRSILSRARSFPFLDWSLQ